MIRILKQTSNFEDLLKKIHDTDNQRRMLESRLNSEISNVRNITEINRAQTSYL